MFAFYNKVLGDFTFTSVGTQILVSLDKESGIGNPFYVSGITWEGIEKIYKGVVTSEDFYDFLSVFTVVPSEE